MIEQLHWEDLGKLWLILLGLTLVFEAFKWLIKKIKE